MIFATAALAAEPEIELVGVLGSAREFQASLKTKGADPKWVAVGQQFAGYTVASYDPKAETVTLTKDGRQFRFQLGKGRIAAGTAELPAQVQRDITNNLRQLSAAADQFYLENGRSTTTYDEIVGPTKFVRVIEAKAGENYRAIEFAQGKTLRVTTSSGHVVNFVP